MPRLPDEVEEYFPYRTVRPYQDDFINVLWEAIKDRRNAVVEGSNGLGKTVSALSACLPTVRQNDMQIIYVAKTHRQHDRVIEELKAIAKRKKVSGVSLRGRSEMCFHPMITRRPTDARSAMEICELLKKRHQCPYYTNIETKTENSIDLQLHIASNAYTATEIQEQCRKEKFCPYEITKLILSEVDVVALSYLYVFDPTVRPALLKQLERPLAKLVLVIDEAHNLPNTAIEIASDNLSLFSIRQAEQEAKQFSYRDIAAFSSMLRTIIEKMASRGAGKEALVDPELFVEMIEHETEISDSKAFFDHLHETGNRVRQRLFSEGKFPQSHIHRMGDFFSHWLETTRDEAFIHALCRYITKREAPSARLEIVALDPARITKPIFSAVYSNIIMSGTLEPLESYVKITGMPDNTIQKAVPSPFPKEHVLALTCLGVTTAMEQRTPAMYRKIVNQLVEVTRNTPANTGIFAASYEVLDALLKAGIKEAIDKPLFHEERAMKSKENEQLIKHFKSHAQRGGAVLLGVQGGRSSEGTDYPGDQMNSAVIVGVPYAEPTPRTKAQIDYYEKRFPKLGREFGYILPALKKAAQAAGRPIRTLEDKGAIIFLDYRFATPYCQRFLPAWIRRSMKILPDKNGLVAQELMAFFPQVAS